MTQRRFLVTAALPYSNGRLHVGHIAGAYLPADTYVRYLRAAGADVRFICGSDDNGSPADTTAPTVLSTSPTGTGIATNSAITVTFSETMDATTIVAARR